MVLFFDEVGGILLMWTGIQSPVYRQEAYGGTAVPPGAATVLRFS